MVDKDKCISLHGKMTSSQAARLLGCSRNTVLKIWHKASGLCVCGRVLEGGGASCARCKESKRAYNKRHYARNVEKMRKYGRDNRRRYLYGLSPLEYEDMVRSQEGVCAICKQPETRLRDGKPESLAVDHDHVTGKVRGLLCHKCNVVLGHVGESVQILETMIQYLGNTVDIA